MRKVFRKESMAILMGAFLLSLPLSSKAEAAVLVYDAQNVEQAIKTAITTADILTNEQKQLALRLIDMRKMGASEILSYLTGMAQNQRYALDEKNSQIGILANTTSVDSFWEKNFHNVEAVLAGKMTVMDAFYAGQAAYKAEMDTNKDSLSMAGFTQAMSDEYMKQTQEALKRSSEAEGNLAALQAGTQVTGIGVMSMIQGNNLLSNMAASNAVKYQRELQEQAVAEQINRTTAEKLQTATDGCRMTAVSWEQMMQEMGEDY